jgi:SH3-like domain-containing protein
VQQAEPFASPLLRQPGPDRVRAVPGHPVPGKPAKHLPLVRPRADAHAVKPAPAPATPPAASPAPQATSKAAVPAAPPPPKFDATKGTVTGAPLPRWASLRSDQVNLRRGPGTRYPIDWEYHRRDLPVQIEREFEVWRLVQDQDGIKGWVHEATLSGRRGFIVTGAERVLRDNAADNAAPVARLKPGVVGRIRHCDVASAWCEVQVADYRGWLKRDEFWGTSPGEAVPP